MSSDLSILLTNDNLQELKSNAALSLTWNLYPRDLFYKKSKLSENDIEALDRLRRDITDSYAKGKITEQQFGELKSEISILYEEIYNKKIDSLNSMSDENNRKKIMLNNVKNEIMDAYAKGKITESHYNLLNEKILVLLSYHY
jgi:uncharacterized membrane protein